MGEAYTQKIWLTVYSITVINKQKDKWVSSFTFECNTFFEIIRIYYDGM